MPSFTRALTLAVALPMMVLAVGCSAADKHEFYSTITQPTSVVLVDTYRGEEVWSMDIPVNHMLSLDFKGNAQGEGGSAMAASSSVAWELHEVNDQPKPSGYGKIGALLARDTIDLTGKRVRMVVNYRESPEMPGTIDAASVPIQETAQSVAAEAIAESRRSAPKQMEQASPEAAAPAHVDADEEAEAVEEVVAEEVHAPPATQPTK